jgi:hypothetical protein
MMLHFTALRRSSRGVRVLHVAVRRRRVEVQVLAGADLRSAVNYYGTLLPYAAPR